MNMSQILRTLSDGFMIVSGSVALLSYRLMAVMPPATEGEGPLQTQ